MLKKLYHYINKTGSFPKPAEGPVVIIESDDWGSIRMPSKEILMKVSALGSQFTDDPYLQYDRLESTEDLELLFNLLKSFKDSNGNHPCITANYVMQNPDFEAIKANEFECFTGELFLKTFERYKGCERSFEWEKRGFDEGIFIPQFHAREHIQVPRWMKALQMGDKQLRKAFGYEMISYRNPEKPTCAGFYMDAFNADNHNQLLQINFNVCQGLELFAKVWGYKSVSMIAPCYFWHTFTEEKTRQLGVKLLQGQAVQKEPGLNENPLSFKKKIHFTGERNAFGQRYSVRNVYFEPSLDKGINWIDETLRQTERAFSKTGVAIISAHRLNFMGGIETANRDRNLTLLEGLLTEMLKRWPNVTFTSSDKLLSYIK